MKVFVSYCEIFMKAGSEDMDVLYIKGLAGEFCRIKMQEMLLEQED